MIQNPLSMKARGHIYIAAIIVGALALIAIAVLGVLGLDEWLAVVAATTAAASMLAGSLGRDNLAESGKTGDTHD